MEYGERGSTRTSPCPVPRRRSRGRRRCRLSPSVMAACAGSNTACRLISLEEMIHIPCVSTLVLRPPRASELVVAVQSVQRLSSRCGRWHVFFAFARALFDALLRASAGRGYFRTLHIVEPVSNCAPIAGCSTPSALVPCLTRPGESEVRCVLQKAYLVV